MPSAPIHTLYGAPGSGSAAVEMALQAAGQPWQVVRAATWEPGPGLDALRLVNPLGQIHTLVLPGGTVLTESAAILIHLGLAHPGHGLLPEDPTARAMAIRGLVFIAANCYAGVSVSDYPERWTTATSKASLAKVRAAARVQLHRSWDLFFDTFSADLARDAGQPGALAFLAVVVSGWSGTRAHLKATRPAAVALLSQLEAHPRIAPVLAAHRGG